MTDDENSAPKAVTHTTALATLADCQREYFDILQGNRLVQECELLDADRMVASQRLFSETPLARTTKGWQPSALRDVEALLDDVHQLWSRRRKDITTSLGALEGRYIHVGDGFMDDNVRKYALLFDGVLVSDQLLMTRYDYLNISPTEDFSWQQIALNVAKTAVRFVLMKDVFTKPVSDCIAFVVPATVPLNKIADDRHTDAVGRLTSLFLSELADRRFSSVAEFIEYCQRASPGDGDFEPRLLKIIYSRSQAANSLDYLRKAADFHHTELGISVDQLPIAAQLAIDMGQRLWEIERFAGDAYSWGQEAEIPWYDIPLFDWWLAHSAKEVGKALGSTYSSDFIAKTATLSSSLGFLQNVTTDELMSFRRSDKVAILREDLALHRLHLRHSKEPLEQVIATVGEHIQSKLDTFEDTLAQQQVDFTSRTPVEAFKLAATGALTVAAAAFPPLSAASLMWGGTLADLRSAHKRRRRELEQMMSRPIASLVEWRRRATPERRVAPAT